MIRYDVQEQIVRILDEVEKYLISANKFDWFTMCGILASLLISGVAIWFSWQTSRRQEKLMRQQNIIQNQDLKLSLFDKRFEIYLAIKKFIKLVVSESQCLNDYRRELTNKTSDVQFLFGEEIKIYISELHTNGSKMHKLNYQYKKMCDEGKTFEHDVIGEAAQIEDWFREQFDTELEKIFDKYLNLKKLGL